MGVAGRKAMAALLQDRKTCKKQNHNGDEKAKMT
jgi:hypothetical protein